MFDSVIKVQNEGLTPLYEVSKNINLVYAKFGNDVKLEPTCKEVGFVNELSNLGTIYTKQYIESKLPLEFSRYAEKNGWKTAAVCVKVTYQDVIGIERKIEDGFLADKENGINSWIKRSCEQLHELFKPSSEPQAETQTSCSPNPPG